MQFRYAIHCILLVILSFYVVEGESVNLTDALQNLHGHYADPAEMMQLIQLLAQMVSKQTGEIENLKNQTAEIQTLKQQAEGDRSTIQTLQNRLFFLEAEHNELSKLPSSQEFSTYLNGMNQLTHNLAVNEANDRNLTQLLNNALHDLNQKDTSTTFQLRNHSMELEKLKQLSGNGINQLTKSLAVNEANDRNLTQLFYNTIHDLNQKDLSTTQQLHNYSTELEVLKQQYRLTTQQINDSLIQVIRDMANKSENHAFTVGLPTDNSNWQGSTLVFPDVVFSEGTGYDPRTGIFTAPTAGTYVFYVSVQSDHQKEIRLDIVLNGSTKVRAMAWYGSGSNVSIYQTGTNLVILHLQTGDRVWVRRYRGTGYYSNAAHITTFSGFKLY